jgi:DNA-binding LytR/AlgR family response regulator
MRIAIVDDEQKSIDILKTALEKSYGEFIESISTFNNPLKFIESDSKFDVLFLDIEMPEITGIELSKKDNLTGANIVFVTARESLVFEAYNETNAMGFVRKQKLKADLKIIMEKLTSELKNSGAVIVKKEKGIVRLSYSDIIYVENQGNNILIHTNHGDYNKRYKISDLEKELPDSAFVRCHQGYIMNLKYISYISDKEITIVGEGTIPISRKRIKLVKEKFLRLNGV